MNRLKLLYVISTQVSSRVMTGVVQSRVYSIKSLYVYHDYKHTSYLFKRTNRKVPLRASSPLYPTSGASLEFDASMTSASYSGSCVSPFAPLSWGFSDSAPTTSPGPLIDDVGCLCPQGHRDLTAMWRFAVLYFLSRKRKKES